MEAEPGAPNVPVAQNEIADDDTATTISIRDAGEEQEPSFLPHDFSYIPNRDLVLGKNLLFTHLVDSTIRNPMTHSDDVELPSFENIILDLLSSKHSWCDAIQKQKIIMNMNKNHIADLITANSQVLSDHIRNCTLTYEISTQRTRIANTIIDYSRNHIEYLNFLSEFTEENRELLTIHDGDADEPFDIFQVCLPVWFRRSDGSDFISWISLYKVLTEILFTEDDKASPTLPPPETFSCTRYLSRVFRNGVIANRTPTQYSQGSISLPYMINRIRNSITVGSSNAIFLKQDIGIQYTPEIGKTRYTLSVILRWIEVTHHLLFRGQISHSILYHFYRNIHVLPRRILSLSTVMEKRYINANIRTLTNDTMPDEEVDPVLLVPFEEGQKVYKMRCCRKDLSMGAILGIIRSGRTPVCPMCRGGLFTKNQEQESPIDPTYTEPEVTEVNDDPPLYVSNPRIPPCSYTYHPITLES